MREPIGPEAVDATRAAATNNGHRLSHRAPPGEPPHLYCRRCGRAVVVYHGGLAYDTGEAQNACTAAPQQRRGIRRPRA